MVFGQQVTNVIFYFRNTFLVSDNGKILILPLLNRDTARMKGCILLCLILDELENFKNHPESKHMLWMVASVAMFTGWYPIIQRMLLSYMHSVLASPMQQCRSVLAHMVAFVHVIYCYFCCFAGLWPPHCFMSLSSQIVEVTDPTMCQAVPKISRNSGLVSIKYFLKIMYYMESGSTGNSMICTCKFSNDKCDNFCIGIPSSRLIYITLREWFRKCIYYFVNIFTLFTFTHILTAC